MASFGPGIGGSGAGRPQRRAGHNLLLRRDSGKPDVLRFLTDPRVPFTNNLAERDARMLAPRSGSRVRQNVSGGFADAGNIRQDRHARPARLAGKARDVAAPRAAVAVCLPGRHARQSPTPAACAPPDPGARVRCDAAALSARRSTNAAGPISA